MQTQSNKIDFNGQHVYIGIDVHLKSWTVTIMTELLVHRTFSQPAKPEALYQRKTGLQEIRLESTGNYRSLMSEVPA